MRDVRIENATRPLPEPLRAGYCSSFWCRLRGLAFRSELPEGWGLLLVQTRDSRLDSAIHMLGMRFDLGIVWFNSAGEVVDARLARRWRSFLLPRRPARYVLEMHAARLGEFQIGDIVRFEENS